MRLCIDGEILWYNKVMDNTQGIVIAMGVGLVLVIIFGIYRLLMRYYSSSNTLRSGTKAANRQQVVKTVFAVIVTIVVFVAMYLAYDYFVHEH